MKVVIPVAGLGLQLRPLTFTQPKPLIPIAGKPILSHIIDQFEAAGVTDFVFIIGYLGDKIIDFLNHSYPDLNKSFVFQKERKGIGHAIFSAKDELINCSEMIILLGDTILELDLNQFINIDGSCLGIKKVEDPRLFGNVELANNLVSKLIEKPIIPKTNLAIVGLYKIKEVEQLFNALEYNINYDIKTNDEFQLTDALQRLVLQGVKIKTMEVDNWYDCGQKEIVLVTNANLLTKLSNGQDYAKTYPSSIIIPPVFIGDGCTIENAIVGPNVSVGDHSNILRSSISNSIIGNYATLHNIVLESSIIGSDTTIKGTFHSLNIGDNTEIDLG